MSATAIFRALGDPGRTEVVEELGRGPRTVSDLARARSMSITGMRKHLRVLQDAGLVRCAKSGRVVTCTLDPSALHEAERWLHDRQRYWSATLDRLATLIDPTDTTQEPS